MGILAACLLENPGLPCIALIMCADYAEEQRNELEMLESIYGGDLKGMRVPSMPWRAMLCVFHYAAPCSCFKNYV